MAHNSEVVFGVGHLENPGLKLFLHDELSATKDTVTSSAAISVLIPKIVECKLEMLKLYKQCFSFSDYQFLTSSGSIKWLTLHSCTIKTDDGNNTITVDKLFDNLLHIIKFDM